MDLTREFYVVYQAQRADPSQLAEIEVRVRNIGARWNLGIYEKRLDRLVPLRPGPRLFMKLYFNDYSVLGVSNDEYDFLLTVTEGSGMPLEDLERLIQEVLSELEALGLEFKLQEFS